MKQRPVYCTCCGCRLRTYWRLRTEWDPVTGARTDTTTEVLECADSIIHEQWTKVGNKWERV